MNSRFELIQLNRFNDYTQLPVFFKQPSKDNFSELLDFALKWQSKFIPAPLYYCVEMR